MANEALALPDNELAQRVWATGDNDSFAELFVRHRKKVFYACRGFFPDSQAAEDATQETFLRAFKNIRSFREGEFSRWLMRIAKNVCIDEWRRSRRENSLEDLDASEMPAQARAEPSSDARLMAERIWKEIRLLPWEQRKCLELKIRGFSYEESSASTGMTINAVKSHIQNGRRMLWRRLEHALPESIKG